MGLKSGCNCRLLYEMIITNEDQKDKKGYWICELMSLATQPGRKTELNDTRELALTNNLKEVYYQGYKTAYGAHGIALRKFNAYICLWLLDSGLSHVETV